MYISVVLPPLSCISLCLLTPLPLSHAVRINAHFLLRRQGFELTFAGQLDGAGWSVDIFNFNVGLDGIYETDVGTLFGREYLGGHKKAS